MPPDPRAPSARPRRPARHGSAPASASGARPRGYSPATTASSPCAAMPNSPAASRSANGVLRLEPALDTLPGGTAGLGVTPRRRGGWRCTSPSCPTPIEASRDGSLPATASMAGSASPLRRPWCNRKRASDMRNPCGAHANAVSVNKHPDVGCARTDRHRRPASDGHYGPLDDLAESHAQNADSAPRIERKVRELYRRGCGTRTGADGQPARPLVDRVVERVRGRDSVRRWRTSRIALTLAVPARSA